MEEEMGVMPALQAGSLPSLPPSLLPLPLLLPFSPYHDYSYVQAAMQGRGASADTTDTGT